MKKFVGEILGFFLAIVGFIGCTEDPAPIAVASVRLNYTSMTLVEGDNQTLMATILPSNAENQNVLWSSTNVSVATVAEGVVTAIKPGSATIIVATEDGGKTATCSVTVKAKVYPVTGVTLDKTSYELTEGDAFTLTATVNPSNATNKAVRWTSSQPSVATVSNGTVTALQAGTTVITVTTEDGGKTATCSVTVIIPVTSVSLNVTKMTIEKGDEATLTATVNPTNATNKSLTWSSSFTSVAVVDEFGVVRAVDSGWANITAKAHNGKQATCRITVPARVTGITLWPMSMTILVDETVKLTAEIEPSNASDQTVIWSSDNNEVAVVDQSGNVRGVSIGNTIIRATTVDGGKTATSVVGVYENDLYVDLGLSVCWAKCNLGADSPEKVGDQYAWGEVVSDPPFTDDSYEWGYRSSITGRMHWFKYNTSDCKTVLDLADDAAYVNLGGRWRMPTISQCLELIRNCEVTLVRYNGKYVYKFTSKIPGYTDKSIYLPFYVDSSTTTNFWTAEVGLPQYDFGITWTYDGRGPVLSRCMGRSIRPVHLK